MILRKWNRMLAQWGRKRKKAIVLRGSDTPDRPRKIIVWYDDLKRAKKPPEWLSEILSEDAA